MARARRQKPKPDEPKPDDTPFFGPYQLVDELDGQPVHRLAFGADPIVMLHAGEKFTTEDPAVAAHLDRHPAVTRTEA